VVGWPDRIFRQGAAKASAPTEAARVTVPRSKRAVRRDARATIWPEQFRAS